MNFRHLKTYNFNDLVDKMGEGMSMLIHFETVSRFYFLHFMFFHICFLLPRINKNINTIVITTVPTKQINQTFLLA